jgi:hypothetical protein
MNGGSGPPAEPVVSPSRREKRKGNISPAGAENSRVAEARREIWAPSHIATFFLRDTIRLEPPLDADFRAPTSGFLS